MMRRVILSVLVAVYPAVTVAAPPELPRVYIDTAYVEPPGTVIRVAAGGDLQAAINAANLGDVIELQAGATWTGKYILKNKTTGNGWIYIRTSAYASLPPSGTRVSPADATKMAKLAAPPTDFALGADVAAHHYRLVGIEITGAQAPGAFNSGLVMLDGAFVAGLGNQTSLAQVPHHLIFDRCYIHAGPDVPGSSEFIRGFVMNSAHTALIDSYVSGFRSTTNGDTQAINGFNGPGPYKIVNNYLEAAGENIQFGGAAAAIPNVTPSDMEIRQNLFTKPLSWRPGDPSYAGVAWSVKNLLEFKHGQRVLIEGNTFQNHWSGAQSGSFLVLTPRAEYGQNPWVQVSDITFRNNRVRQVTAGIATSAADSWPQYGSFPPGQATGLSHRVAITNNLFEDLGIFKIPGDFAGLFMTVANGVTDLTVAHNTVFNSYTMLTLAGYSFGIESAFVFVDNILNGNGYAVNDDGSFGGTPVQLLDKYAPGYAFAKNVLIGPWPNANGVPSLSTWWPPDNAFPTGSSAVGFVNFAGGPADYHNYALAASSPFKGQASDGTDPGVNLTTLDGALGISGGVGTLQAPILTVSEGGV